MLSVGGYDWLDKISGEQEWNEPDFLPGRGTWVGRPGAFSTKMRIGKHKNYCRQIHGGKPSSFSIASLKSRAGNPSARLLPRHGLFPNQNHPNGCAAPFLAFGENSPKIHRTGGDFHFSHGEDSIHRKRGGGRARAVMGEQFALGIQEPEPPLAETVQNPLKFLSR